MRDQTDFDALMAGASPEEGRRLRKIFAEWTRGDEDAFPVQMALLTRAQWRSAAAVPRLVEEQRKALADVLAKAEGEIAATTQAVQDSMRVQLTTLQVEVTRQSTALKDATATMRVHLGSAEGLATEIRTNLESGKRAWDQARDKFIEERQLLCAASVDARARFEREQWGSLLLGLALVAFLGFSAGVYVGSTRSMRAVPTTVAPAILPNP